MELQGDKRGLGHNWVGDIEVYGNRYTDEAGKVFWNTTVVGNRIDIQHYWVDRENFHDSVTHILVTPTGGNIIYTDPIPADVTEEVRHAVNESIGKWESHIASLESI
jgi:hypothetical protein